MARMIFRMLVVATGVFGFIIGISKIALADGLNQHEIYRYKVCAPYWKEGAPPPALTDEQAVAIENPTYFPAWGVGLGTYVRALDKINAVSTTETSCMRGMGGTPGIGRGGAALPLMSALAETARRTSELIVADISDQKIQMIKVSACLHALKASKANLKSPVRAEDFSRHNPESSDRPGNEVCANVTNLLVDDLGKRFELMRMYMALQVRPEKTREPLQHDIPFSTFITKHVFASQATRVPTVPGLKSEEFAKLPEFSRNIPDDRNPRELYDNLISTTPILLQIKDSVTPSSIQIGVDSILDQYSFDEKKFMETLDQNIFLHTPYVAVAIESMPKEKRSDACLATSVLYSRLKTKYEKSPQFLATLALMFVMPLRALSAADVAVGGVAKEFAKKTMIGAGVVSGAHAIQLYERFNHGIEMCSTIYRQENVDPEIEGICTLSKAHGIQKDAESIAIANAAFFGAFKLGRPLLSIYSKYGAGK